MFLKEFYLLMKPILPPLIIFLLIGLYFIYSAIKTKRDKSTLMLGRKNIHHWNKPYIEKNPIKLRRWVIIDFTIGIIIILIVLCIFTGYLLESM